MKARRRSLSLILRTTLAKEMFAVVVVDEHLAIVDMQAAVARAAVDPPAECVPAPGCGRVVFLIARNRPACALCAYTACAPPAAAAGRTRQRIARSSVARVK